MKQRFKTVLICLFLLSASYVQFTVGANGSAAKDPSIQAGSSNPTITYAEWIGKNLFVEGINFADGAAVYIDGQKLKSSNIRARMVFLARREDYTSWILGLVSASPTD